MNVRLICCAGISFIAGCSSHLEPPAFEEPVGEENDDLVPAVPREELSAVTLEEARALGTKFLQVRASAAPGWKTASLSEPVLLHGHDDEPAYYLFEVRSDLGAASGSLFVGAAEGRGVFPAFATDEESPASTLIDRISTRLGARYDGKVRFLAEGPALLAAEIRWEDRWGDPSSLGFLPDATRSDVAYYSPDLMTLRSSVDRSEWPSPMRDVGPDELEEERTTRQTYLQLSGDKLEAVVAPSPWVSFENRSHATTARVGSGAVSFDSWYQESRAWTNGTCFTGCSPLAAGILLDYWDANGYSSALDGSNSSHTTARTNLDELRTAMGTVCSSGQGSTSTGNIDNGESFTDSQGYTSWDWNEDNLLKWNTLMSEINAGRPVLLSVNLGTAGHTAVAYEYTDDSGSASDYVCWKTGWTTPTWQCWTRDTYSWYNVVKVQP